MPVAFSTFIRSKVIVWNVTVLEKGEPLPPTHCEDHLLAVFLCIPSKRFRPTLIDREGNWQIVAKSQRLKHDRSYQTFLRSINQLLDEGLQKIRRIF